MTTNDARMVADILLDSVTNFWNGGDSSPAALLGHLSFGGSLGPDGSVTIDGTAIYLGSLLAAVSLSQREFPIGDTHAEQIAAAREYLDALAPYETDSD